MAVTTDSTRQGTQPTGTDRGLRLHTEPEPGTVAHELRGLLVALLGSEPAVRVVLWDGSDYGQVDPAGTITVRSPDALARMLWAPGELGLARAYVAGDLDIDGDILRSLEVLRDAPVRTAGRLEGARTAARVVKAARAVGALGRPPEAPPEEARPRGRRHSKARDAEAISHHYDVGNEFYELVLGPAMTYSCARFPIEGMTLEQAQADKHELVCRKLGLHERPGQRLLAVGCGWGSMAMHAAAHHRAEVVGITISREQAARARQRVEQAGLADRVEIRLQDYRDLQGERFDAISSIGMFEHVGKARTTEYFGILRELLTDRGRLLNHAISSVRGSRLPRRSFTYRYVFPDGELLDVADVCGAMESAGFEVRDVESLREHYARTLRHWVANLEASWDRAVALAGEPRARVWRLYMAGSALGFEDGGIGLHQVLGAVPTPDGDSGMPRTRDGGRTTIQ
ncbi:MAG: class I SAM-dependent methyltransferase [Actinomycetota bacterium]